MAGTSDVQELQEPVSVATPTRATGKRKSPGVPSDYCCPITLSPFIDPVTLLGDLEVYERRAIEQWLETSSKSPMHGTDLKSVSVVANSRMKGILEDAMNANRFGTDETKNWRVRVRANQEQKAVSEVEALKAQALDETTEKTARKEAARRVIEVLFNKYTSDDGFSMEMGASNEEKKRFLWLGARLRLGRAFQYLSFNYLCPKKRKDALFTANKVMSSFYLGQAVASGDHHAHAQAGIAFADGTHGFDLNKEEARYHLSKAKTAWPSNSCTATLDAVTSRLDTLDSK